MSGTLRVTIVGPLAPPAGGMARQTRQLCDLLRGEGIRAGVLQTNAPYRPAFIARVRGIRALFRLVPYLWQSWKSAADSDVLHVMANSGWAWHLFAAPAIWIGKIRGIRVVVNYRGGAAEAFLARSAMLVRATLRVADELVVPSEFLLGTFAKFRIPATIVPNVVDTEHFHPNVPNRGWDLNDRPHVVVPRNLESIYDVGTAIRAFAMLRERRPRARLTIAGDGPERASLEALATELRVRDAVEFRGMLSRDAMAELYRSATIVLNSSVVDNTPNAFLEAMACGVPIVSSDVGGIPFLVRDRHTALLCPARDPAALARAMDCVLDDPALRARMVANGRKVAQGCVWSAVFPQWMHVYQPGVDEHDATNSGSHRACAEP